MILHVTGVETIEITDPKGVCRQVNQGQLPPPNIQPYQPTPQIPTPFGPGITPTVPAQWRKKWQPGFTGDPTGSFPSGAADTKWTKNMQLAIAGEDLKAGQVVKERTSGSSSKTYSA